VSLSSQKIGAGAILLAVLIFWCAAPPDAFSSPAAPRSVPRPSLLLITAEGLRPDRLGCYRGKKPAATPAIDALAGESRLFEQVLSSSPSMVPAIASLMTGQTPFQHRVWEDHYRNRLPPEAWTLAERLKKERYRTAAFVGTSRLAAERGLDQGFDLYQDGYTPPPTGVWRLMQRRGTQLVPAARNWLEGIGKDPFFLWIHLDEAAMPTPYHETPSADEVAYSNNVADLDARVADLVGVLKERQLYDTTAIVLTADHGMGLGDHGEARAGVFLYDSTLRVPLLIKEAAGGKKGTRSADLAGAVDLFPTVERLLKIPPTPGLAGRDLLASAPARPAYYAVALKGREVFGWAGSELVARGSSRLILGPAVEFYDVATDPRQEHDLASSANAPRRDLEQERRRISKGSALPPPHFLPSGALPPPAAKRLVRLGYVEATVEKAMSRRAPDARRSVPYLRLLEFAHLGEEVLGFQALKSVAVDLLKEDPEGLFTLLNVSRLRMEEDDGKGESVKAAKELLKSAQKLYPRDAEVYHMLGHLAFLEKTFSEAEFFLTLAGGLSPRYPSEISYDLACAQARLGKKPEAVAELQKAIRLGYKDQRHIAGDPDLESLQKDPSFKRLMEEEFPSGSGG
jgi:choline-sulfatase